MGISGHDVVWIAFWNKVKKKKKNVFSRQNYVLSRDRWGHVYRAVAGEGVRALWKEAAAEAEENDDDDDEALNQTHLTHEIVFPQPLGLKGLGDRISCSYYA